MELPITEDYLLATEKITDRPMLRTRFTTQAYLVFATFLDLRDQGLLVFDENRVSLPDPGNLADQLPASLQVLATRLQAALAESTATVDVFKLLVSWDLANAIYDTVGPALQQKGQAKSVTFQNNLLPHIIYVATASGKQGVLDRLTQQLEAHALTTTSRDLLLIFDQLQALKWVLPSAMVTQARNQLPEHPGYQTVSRLMDMAQHEITMRKFELDSWLS